MVFTDAHKADRPIIFANDSFLKLTGFKRDEVMAQRFDFVLGSNPDLDTVRAIEASFDDTSTGNPEMEIRRKDGSACWVSLFVNPVPDERGRVVQHFVSMEDITHHKQAQRDAAMMIDELNHRVKNTLATVQSIVTQTLRSSEDPMVVREAIETRIAAIARSHDLLSRRKWGGAAFRDLVDEALAPFGAADEGNQRFTIEGENIWLSPRTTLALGIAINELATNAVKYGALSNEAGSVSIDWTVQNKSAERWLYMHWRETGGPPVSPPTSKGFGSRVIEHGLSHELGGELSLDFAPEGIRCTIHVPAPEAAIDG